MSSEERQEFWRLIAELKATANRVQSARARDVYDPEDFVVLRGNVERIIEIAEQGEPEHDPPLANALPRIGHNPSTPQIGVLTDHYHPARRFNRAEWPSA